MKTVGVDIGGTFTDFMLYDTESAAVHVHKVRSTPDDPGRAMVTRARRSSAAAPRSSRRTSTRSSTGRRSRPTRCSSTAARVSGMLTTKGFRDVVHIGRHQRPQHYSIMQDIPWQARPFVRRRHRHVVTERIVPPTGEVLEPLDEDEVRTAARALKEAGVESVAVCFLFSYINPEHERRAAEIVAEEMPDAFVTSSADIFPQFREFERFTTACMNAFVGPSTGRYLERLGAALRRRGGAGNLHVMMSNGGVASRADARPERPVTLLLSGPAAGVLGGPWAGESAGRKRLITFDVGGTSADIGIVTEHGIGEASARDTWVGGLPAARADDRHPHDRGGRRLDRIRRQGGAFRVGPRSAGAIAGAGLLRPRWRGADADGRERRARADRSRAVPRRARCGSIATRRRPRSAARRSARARPRRGGGGHDHDRERQHGPRDPVADGPEGTRSTRVRAVAFGGAGPLHAAEVAESLDIPEVIVPPHPGITSASGLLDQRPQVRPDADGVHDQGAIDDGSARTRARRRGRELRGRLGDDGVATSDIEVARRARLPVRRPGLRAAPPRLAGGRFTPKRSRSSTAARAGVRPLRSGDPIEIVNLRVTRGRQAAAVPSGNHGRATPTPLLGEGERIFRCNGSLTAHPTRFYERALLPVGESLPGPAVHLPARHDHDRPARLEFRADSSGSLILRRMSAAAEPARSRASTRSRPR